MKTSSLYLLNRLLCSPLEAMFTLLIFIVSKEAGATSLQLAVLAASKPLVSLLAFYASLTIVNRAHRVRPYLSLLSILGCLPCLFFPFIQNLWFYVISFALYTTTSRAAFPAWAEILKSQVGLNKMSGLVSRGTSLNYTMMLFLPVSLSFWMDKHVEGWKIIFFILAVLQILNLFIIFFLKINPHVIQKEISTSSRIEWTAVKKIVKEDHPFIQYLLMFLLGGAGIVAMQSVLPIYFKENLNLSYKQLTLAFSFCKGIAFVLSSPLWARYVNRMSLYRLNFFIDFFTCLFMLSILAANTDVKWLFFGYLMYGTMQGGCELTWNMSGPVFSKEKESTLYSSLNLVLVGIRGCICPFAGQLIFLYFGAEAVFMTAFVVCLIGLFYALRLDSIYHKKAKMGLKTDSELSPSL